MGIVVYLFTLAIRGVIYLVLAPFRIALYMKRMSQ